MLRNVILAAKTSEFCRYQESCVTVRIFEFRGNIWENQKGKKRKEKKK